MRHFLAGFFATLFLIIAIEAASLHVVGAAPIEDTSSWTNAPISVTTSSGATPVQLVAGTSGRRVVPIRLSIKNADTVDHTVTLLTGTATLDPIIVPASSIFAWRDTGWEKTNAGDALQFKIDAGGSGTSVTVSGFALK